MPSSEELLYFSTPPVYARPMLPCPPKICPLMSTRALQDERCEAMEMALVVPIWALLTPSRMALDDEQSASATNPL